jgi:hypothetical protein
VPDFRLMYQILSLLHFPGTLAQNAKRDSSTPEQVQDLALHERLGVSVSGSNTKGSVWVKFLPGATALKECENLGNLLPLLQGRRLPTGECQPKGVVERHDPSGAARFAISQRKPVGCHVNRRFGHRRLKGEP